jgi:DNA-binding protein H-NS
MSTLQQLLEQQANLAKQIENTRREEKSSAIAQVKELMEVNGLTVADLGLKGTRSQAGRTDKAKVAAKYRDTATGATWSGRGLKPRWLATAIEGGKKIEDFAV